MVKVKAIIEGDSTHGYSVYMDDETLGYSVNGQGDTVAEAVADFREVYAEMIAFLKEEGRPCTEVEFEFVHSYGEDGNTTLQDELKKLETMLPDGLTPEVAELINKIKATYTGPSDREELEKFVCAHLKSVKEDVLQLVRDASKLK